MDATSFSKVKELVAGAQNIFIATHEHPTPDSIGSSLALSLGLASIGKKVTVACPDLVTVALSNFIGVNKIQSDVEKKNFVISLDYVDGSIEKVSYNIEGDKFNLVIEPRPGFESLSQEKVHYSYAGASGDLIIVIDTLHLGGLKKIYDGDREFFASKQVINIDRHPNNSQFGAVNIVDGSVSSTAELVARTLSYLGVRLTEDIATNILNAVYGATNNLQNANVGAGAFELIAACMKAGGKKFSVTGENEVQQISASPSGQPVVAESRASVQPQASAPTSVQPGQPAAPVQKPVNPEPKDVPAVQTNPQRDPARQATPGQAPADWLKPKIFKSSNLS